MLQDISRTACPPGGKRPCRRCLDGAEQFVLAALHLIESSGLQGRAATSELLGIVTAIELRADLEKTLRKGRTA